MRRVGGLVPRAAQTWGYEGARFVGAGFAGLTTVALGQAVLHERSYRPLPPNETSPTIGLELPERTKRLTTMMAEKTRETLTRSDLAAFHEKLKAKQRKTREDLENATRAWRERLARGQRTLKTHLPRRLTSSAAAPAAAVVVPDASSFGAAAPSPTEHQRRAFSDDAVGLAATSDEGSSKQQQQQQQQMPRWWRAVTTVKKNARSDDDDDADAATKEGSRAPRYRVLFIGDSLVTGVGGDHSDALQGPPLPRRVCRALADRLGIEVEWRALGLTGGDLGALRSRLVPELRENMTSTDATYDVVVVMCGLNDFKWLARGQLRTPWAFGDELGVLVDEIRGVVGRDARIVLPALPVALASFREPLKSYVCFLANRWDEQKKRLADTARFEGTARVEFVDAALAADLVDGVSGGLLGGPEDDDTTASRRRRPPTTTEEENAAVPTGPLVASDGVHPSERGYEHWAQHIAAALVGERPVGPRLSPSSNPPAPSWPFPGWDDRSLHLFPGVDA